MSSLATMPTRVPAELPVIGAVATEGAGAASTSDDARAFDLFRRAIVDRDEAAWAAAVERYRGLVCAWLAQRAPAGDLMNFDDLTIRVFERLWLAVSAERFNDFTGLPGILRYLKLCAAHAVIDERRRMLTWERHRAEEDAALSVEGDRVDEAVVERLHAAALWAAVEQALSEPDQRLVIYLSFVVGLKPRQIVERAPEVFPTAQTVYACKRQALERLARHARLHILGRGQRMHDA
jgi:hypothetical protein